MQRALPMRTARNASSAARTLWRARALAPHARRSIASTAAAVKPTATVKKAVKAAAATKAAPKTATKKKAAAATKAKPKTAAAKKKTAAKKPAAKKKKPAAKKAAPKKRVKKELTEEQKAKADIAHLRKVALREPVTHTALSPLNVYIADQSTKAENSVTEGRAAVRDRLSGLATAFKNLTPAELEHWNHVTNERNAAKRAQYKAWIESHTPDEIRLANNARRQLRKKVVNNGKAKYPPYTGKLIDERVPKRPLSAYLHFAGERHASGDFKGIPIAKAASLVAAEWKILSASEKQRFEELSKAARAKHGSEPPAKATA